MVSSTKASMSIQAAKDMPAPTDKSVVASEKADNFCYVCSKQIVDPVQPLTQCGAATTQAMASSAAADYSCSALNFTDNQFVCNICLDGCSQDPVVTHCGHLFCWPCLFCWLSQQPGFSQLPCPVCKADVRDKIIPLYDHGPGTRRADRLTLDSAVTTAGLFPDMQIPSRPLPNRLSDVPPTIGTGAAATEYYTGRDSDFYGIDEDDLIAEGMQYHSNGFSASRAELHTSRRISRFASKKGLVLHWAFLCMASIATVCFVIAC